MRSIRGISSFLPAKQRLNTPAPRCVLPHPLASSVRLNNSSASCDTGKKAYFGNRIVDESEKSRLVKGVFESVSRNYDLMNDVMSLGIHRLWKRYFVEKIAPTSTTSLIDVAGGTGDITFGFLRHAKELYGDASNVSAELVDINAKILEIAIENADVYAPELNADLTIGEGDAEDLKDVPSESKDVYTIAFGLRNCTRIDRVLSEAYRVLKPGGKFMCLEFSYVSNSLVSILYDAYSFNVLPMMGEVIAKDREAYQYLVESIRKFPKQGPLAEMIRHAGFSTLGDGWENLLFGIAAIHTGHKPL